MRESLRISEGGAMRDLILIRLFKNKTVFETLVNKALFIKKTVIKNFGKNVNELDAVVYLDKKGHIAFE
jgi:hypothetical protein